MPEILVTLFELHNSRRPPRALWILRYRSCTPLQPDPQHQNAHPPQTCLSNQPRTSATAAQGNTRTPCQQNNDATSGVNIQTTVSLDSTLRAVVGIPDRGAARLWNRNPPAWGAPLVQVVTTASPNLQFPAFDIDGAWQRGRELPQRNRGAFFDLKRDGRFETHQWLHER
jgi:hypothetical protein